jgi:hypothetical protein
MAAFVIGLPPDVNIIILPAHVVGALVEAWHAAAVRRPVPAIQRRAKHGFLSTFFGMLVGIFGTLFGLVVVKISRRRSAR